MVAYPSITQVELVKVAQLIAEATPVDRIILFGSRAKGASQVDSDVDLAVVLPEGADLRAGVKTIHRALWPRPFPVDVVPISASDWRTRQSQLIREIADTGITLYPHAG
ncbi:MAG: nucleotidyltransferase domain-containing protein [Opitutus sp.]|jgi:predicted nucleotidyltransferase|nr:nucleotidyltransferase domain-containing protein [Opitutus sp.]MCS6273787.1 nucleotidyltransferase domain-containing protein [Opitutus sp.]MCS6277658.1 nucleotidyltransferase domain-containing protein [Opitutus sp.]MCS6300776.1 nucleotidyltransferase domain-containing protein [Opitutus sp.]